MVENLVDLKHENVLDTGGSFEGGRFKLNLGHSRQRAIYWRQDGSGNWVPTRPLPADPISINLYFSKGFRAKPPEQSIPQIKSPGEVNSSLKCGCGFEAKNEFGLRVHKRTHK